jgi:hypothetical protein
MKLLTKKLALALLLASVAVASASPVGAAGRGQSTRTPLAGPWYTPQELKALIAYSNASFAQKKAMLAGSTAPSVATNRGLVLAGPRYTPRELKALIAYSKASYAQKKAVLAGAEPSRGAHVPALGGTSETFTDVRVDGSYFDPSIGRRVRVTPTVTIVEPGPFDWGDAGVGAAGAFGLALLASGITLVSRHNRRSAS